MKLYLDPCLHPFLYGHFPHFSSAASAFTQQCSTAGCSWSSAVRTRGVGCRGGFGEVVYVVWLLWIVLFFLSNTHRVYTCVYTPSTATLLSVPEPSHHFLPLHIPSVPQLPLPRGRTHRNPGTSTPLVGAHCRRRGPPKHPRLWRLDIQQPHHVCSGGYPDLYRIRVYSCHQAAYLVLYAHAVMPDYCIPQALYSGCCGCILHRPASVLCSVEKVDHQAAQG